MAGIKASNPMSDDDWEAEQDVKTMARAHAIKNNPERHKRMKHKAKKMIAESRAQKQRAIDEVKEAHQMIKMGEGK